MSNIYDELNLGTVINAQSWVTRLGGSIMPPEVINAMNQASEGFVDIEKLHDKCSDQIAKLCNSESALITAGCASAIVLMSASIICNRDEKLIDKIPNLEFRPEILIHEKQRNHYDIFFEMTGAKLIEYRDKSSLINKISDKSVAVAFVEAPFLGSGLGIKETVNIAKEFNLPVIVDSSARVPPVSNLFKFIKAGANMVCYSGGKGIRGPQNSGFIIGDKKYIDLARKNLICFSDERARIGRSMKVSKECLIGITTALKLFLDTDQDAVWNEWKRKAGYIVNELLVIDGIDVKLEDGGINREGPQAVIYFTNSWTGLSAKEISSKLSNGDPSIYVGNDGYSDEINLAMTNVQDGEEIIIVKKLREILLR